MLKRSKVHGRIARVLRSLSRCRTALCFRLHTLKLRALGHRLRRLTKRRSHSKRSKRSSRRSSKRSKKAKRSTGRRDIVPTFSDLVGSL
jgi:hypothetical protein